MSPSGTKTHTVAEFADVMKTTPFTVAYPSRAHPEYGAPVWSIIYVSLKEQGARRPRVEGMTNLKGEQAVLLARQANAAEAAGTCEPQIMECVVLESEVEELLTLINQT